MNNSTTNQRILAELERLYPDAVPELHFSNPYQTLVATMLSAQSTDRQAVTKSQISALTSKGPDGASATQVLYDAINQTPAPYPSGYAAGGAWSQFAEGNAAFWTNDSSSWITMEIEAVLSTFTIAMTQGVALGNGSGWSVGGTTVPTQPIYAYLTGRTWWPEAASAASFEPPQPPTG